MDKYIGFDIDSKKVSVCVIESGKEDVYATIGPDIGSMKQFLLSQKKDGSRLHLAYEVSGYSGYIHDQLCETVDRIAVAKTATSFLCAYSRPSAGPSKTQFWARRKNMLYKKKKTEEKFR